MNTAAQQNQLSSATPMQQAMNTAVQQQQAKPVWQAPQQYAPQTQRVSMPGGGNAWLQPQQAAPMAPAAAQFPHQAQGPINMYGQPAFPQQQAGYQPQVGYQPQPYPMQQQQPGFSGYGQQRMQAQQQNPMYNPALAWRPPPQMGPTQPAQHPQPQMYTPQQARLPAPTAAPAMAPQQMAPNRPMPASQFNPGSNPVHQAMSTPQANGGGAMAMSDETQKVVDQRSVADDFLDHMKPYTYKYKDPSLEPRIQPTGGTYMGVMAQDLERVPGIGHQLVIDTPHGKMVDQKTALSATMAGLARLNERMRAVEQDSLGKGGDRGTY